MAVKLFLNSQTILNHEFPLTHKNAYNAEEVDKFLDMVMQDYKVVESNVIVPIKEYETLKEKNKMLIFHMLKYRLLHQKRIFI